MPDLTPVRTGLPSGDDLAARRYLDLLKGCLTREMFETEQWIDAVYWVPDDVLGDPDLVWTRLHRQGWRLIRLAKPGEKGETHIPQYAETMVSRARLDNVEAAIRTVVAEGVPGDLVETGVWRGGTVILMRAVLELLGSDDRTVWACDSFEGLPEPDPEKYPEDAAMTIPHAGDKSMVDRGLAVSVEQVKDNFRRYGLLDDQVRFVEGWFSESLPTAPIHQIAVLRLDGDLYESTLDALNSLEPKVAPGGFVIVDDYGALEPCRAAVEDYRRAHDITDPIEEIDWTGAYWRKSARPG